MRQVVLDTETTGFSAAEGHRIVEIALVEMIDRKLTGKVLHHYLQPEREIDAGAMKVHGITNEFVKDKPKFKEIAVEFLEFIDTAELIIHNAPFDISFLDAELIRAQAAVQSVATYCGVIDTLLLARQKYPGKKNSLDALCERFGIDNSHRDFHGALLDTHLLVDVYLALTGGQTSLSLPGEQNIVEQSHVTQQLNERAVNVRTRVIKANADELLKHDAYVIKLES